MNEMQALIRKAVHQAIEPLVEQIADLQQQIKDQQPMLDVRQKAKLLGVTPETIRRKVRSGELRCDKRIGNRMLFKP